MGGEQTQGKTGDTPGTLQPASTTWQGQLEAGTGKIDQETCFECALALLLRNMLKNSLTPFEGHHPCRLLTQ